MKKKQLAPLVIPAILWAVGIIIGKYCHVPVPVAIWGFILVFLLCFIKKLRLYSLLISIVFLAIIRLNYQINSPPNHISSIIKNYPQIIQPVKGKIVSEVIKKKHSYSFTLELIEIDQRAVYGRIKFYAAKDSLHYGDIIETIAEIGAIPKSSNPVTFNYEEYLAAKGLFAQGYAKSMVTVLENKKEPLKRVSIEIRKFIRDRINKRFEKFAGFIKAIIIADKSELDEKRNILNKAGLSHLLAVSGLHVGILSLIFFALLNIFIPHRNISRVILMLLLVIYGEICLWSPSVSRAVLMINLYLLSCMIQRKTIPNNILAASFIIITTINPLQLFSIGLQMSFVAVIVLLNILPGIRLLKLKRDELELLSNTKKILNGILTLMFSSLILSTFLAPLTMLHFNQLNFNGILGNLVGIPIISFILPLALLIVFIPELSFILQIYQFSFQAIMKIFDAWSHFSSSLPLHFGFLSINIYQFIALYIILIFTILFIRNSGKKCFWHLSIIVLLSVFVLSMGTGNKRQLKITFFDCGLGDLFLIETPDDETILIDTGPLQTTSKSFGKCALPYFKNKGIQKLDWLIITHAHNDHYGGMETVLEELHVQNLVVTDEFQTRHIWEKILPEIESEGCKIITVSDTMHLPVSGINCRILHPDKEYSDVNINNLSIAVRIDLEDFSVLFTGDLEKEAESYLLEKYMQFLDCDILKVGHHGSKTSSSPTFLKVVSPDYAFIPTSLKNRFHFPHELTLQKYEYLEENLFIAGKDGALQIITDGKSAHFKTYLSGKEFSDFDLK